MATLTCPFCAEQIVNTREAKTEHWYVHLRPVTDNHGQAAFTFTCPICGPMPLAWGGGRAESVALAKANGQLANHLTYEHGIDA